ncbi:MAG: TolC family protein [Gemmatimonadetes bacterium]|nr:TolC family protein [Gemmatimonadota bacterium]
MHKRLALCCLLLAPYFTAHDCEAQTPQLEVLISEALSRHPRLQALAALTRAQHHLESPAAAWPDPMVRFDLLNVPTSEWDFGSSPMSGRQLGVAQRLPWPGRRDADRRLASTQTQIAAARAADARAGIVDAVKQAYYELAFVDRALVITSRNQDLLRDFVRIAQTKYSVGRGRQQDILKAQVSLSGLGDRILVLQARRDVAEARLNALRDREVTAPMPPPMRLEVTDFNQSLTDLTHMAFEARPALVGLRHQVEHWQAAEEVARLGTRPDIDVQLAYRQRSFDTDQVAGSDFVSAGIAVKVPLWRNSRQHQQAAAARQRQSAATSELAATKLDIELRLRELLIKAGLHRAEMELLRDAILPQAQQALTASVAGYRVDHVDFLTLLDSQVTLQQFEIDLHRQHIDYEKTLASLEAVVGVRLF